VSLARRALFTVLTVAAIGSALTPTALAGTTKVAAPAQTASWGHCC